MQRRTATTRLCLLFAALAIATHVPGFAMRLFNSDEASIATMAMVINHGGKLYHQIADRKPPVVPYVYAGVFKLVGSRDLRPVRALGALILALTAFLLAEEARKLYRSRRAAVWCGAVFLLAYAAFFPDDSQAATFELFMLLPLTAAVLSARRGRAVQAGLLLAAACLCKQTAATTILPVAYLLYRSGGWRPVARAVGSGLGLIAATAVAFGPSQFLLWTFSGNRGYIAFQGSLGSALLRGLGMTAALVGINLALIAICVYAGVRRKVAPELWLWLAGAAIGVLAGLRFFGHYYLQLLPPLVLITASVVPDLARSTQRWLMTAAAVPAVVMVGIAFIPQGDIPTLPYRQVATRVRAITGQDDTVFVWGDFPEVYWASGRRPGTRLVHTGFVTGNTGGRDNASGDSNDGVPGAWAMLRRDLAAHPPDLIVDTTHAAIRQSEYYPLSATPLWRLVESDYRLVGDVAGVNLYRYESASKVR